MEPNEILDRIAYSMGYNHWENMQYVLSFDENERNDIEYVIEEIIREIEHEVIKQ